MPPRLAKPEIHVGCSGWYYWRWRGLFYPQELPERDWFKYYTSKFKTVELNAPFYKWPKPATVRTWIRQAPANFNYSIKVNQLITHEKKLARTAGLVTDFCSMAQVLEGRMGCFLFQLPPSFHYSKARLDRIVGQLGCTCRPVVEFRHKSWWRDSVYEALGTAQITFCSVSAPRLPGNVICANGRVYLRLHGVKQWYRHDYSREELNEWAEKIGDTKPTEVWVYFDNDANANAPRNALSFERLLRRKLK
jgi:uncharacterized protein YecE (DUF72 family)